MPGPGLTVFHPVTETVELVSFAERSGQARRNVEHYKYSLAAGPRPTAAELTTLAGEWVNQVLDFQEDLTVVGTIWTKVTVRDIHDSTGAAIEFPTTRAASMVGSVLPGAMSFCLSKRSGIPGPRNRGRFYLFDLEDAFFAGDDLNVVFIGAINNLVTRLMAPRVGGRFIPCIASKRSAASVPWISTVYDLVADTQTRRGKGRGI